MNVTHYKNIIWCYGGSSTILAFLFIGNTIARGDSMDEYNKGSHTIYDIKYHIIWVTKYRYHVLNGNVALVFNI